MSEIQELSRSNLLKFGINNQVKKLSEEFNEFRTAFNDLVDHGLIVDQNHLQSNAFEDFSAVKSELADIYIVMASLSEYFFDNTGDRDAFIRLKLKKLKEKYHD